MIVVGHRGAAGHKPENTIASFDAALAMGVDAIEFDVLLTKDDIPIVFHDRDLERLTGVKGLVRDRTLSEIATLEVKGGGAIPTLAEVLERYATKLELFVEVKDPRAALPTAQMCAGLPIAAKPFSIISFKEQVLRDIHAQFPGITLGFNWQNGPWQEAKKLLEEIKPQYFNPDQVLVDRACVEYAHSQGMKMAIWTVNEMADIVRIKSLGVDAIISDYPDRVR